MAVATAIDSETGARTHVVTGELTPDELLQALESVYDRSDYRPGACVLWDLTGAQLHRFDKSDIRRIADYVSANRGAPKGTCSALVVSRDLDFGLARMYEQMLVAATDVRVMVFRDIEEARAWLRGEKAE
jgi:hypothetical protein